MLDIWGTVVSKIWLVTIQLGGRQRKYNIETDKNHTTLGIWYV